MTTSARELTERFFEALHALERDGTAALRGMLELFAHDARLTNAVIKRSRGGLEGPGGVEEFWRIPSQLR